MRPGALNGSPFDTTCNNHLGHDFIELFQEKATRISDKCEPLYAQGHSLREISSLTGLPVSTIRDQLTKAGVALRSETHITPSEARRQGFKSKAPPPYGFRYIGGRLEKDPGEYPVLLSIYHQWRSGKSGAAIVAHLNNQGFKTKRGRQWQRATIFKIINRLEVENFKPEGS